MPGTVTGMFPGDTQNGWILQLTNLPADTIPNDPRWLDPLKFIPPSPMDPIGLIKLNNNRAASINSGTSLQPIQGTNNWVYTVSSLNNRDPQNGMLGPVQYKQWEKLLAPVSSGAIGSISFTYYPRP